MEENNNNNSTISSKNIDDIIGGVELEINKYCESLFSKIGRNIIPSISNKKISRKIILPDRIAILACTGLLDVIKESYVGEWHFGEVLIVYAKESTPQSDEIFKKDIKMFSKYYNALMFGNIKEPIYSEAFIGIIKMGKRISNTYVEIIGADIFEKPSVLQPKNVDFCKMQKNEIRNISLEGRVVKIPLSQYGWEMLESEKQLFLYWEPDFMALLMNPNRFDYYFYTDNKQKLFSPKLEKDDCMIDEEEEESDPPVYRAKEIDSNTAYLCFDFNRLVENINNCFNSNLFNSEEWILDWNCVTFYNQYLIIKQPSNNSIQFKPELKRNKIIVDTFNKIRYYLNNKISPIRCTVKAMQLCINDENCLNKALEEFKKTIKNNQLIQYIDKERKDFNLFLEKNNLILHGYLNKFIPFNVNTIREVVKTSTSENLQIDIAIIIFQLSQKIKDKSKILKGCEYLLNQDDEFKSQIIEYINAYNKYNSNDDIFFDLNDFKYKKICENGIFHLPWNYITFFNDYIWLKHPNNPDRVFRHNLPGSKTSLNLVTEYLNGNVPLLLVEAKDNRIVKICDKERLENIVQVLKPELIAPKFDLVAIKRNVNYVNSLSNNEIKKEIKKKDSKFLDYLCQIQNNKYKLIYGLERRVNANLQESFEEYFIFTIADKKNKTIVVYENVLVSRSTIVFVIEKSKYTQAIEIINAFFSSTKVNKRQEITNNRMSLVKGGIISVHRIIHDYFFSWEKSIQNLKYF